MKGCDLTSRNIYTKLGFALNLDGNFDITRPAKFNGKLDVCIVHVTQLSSKTLAGKLNWWIYHVTSVHVTSNFPQNLAGKQNWCIGHATSGHVTLISPSNLAENLNLRIAHVASCPVNNPQISCKFVYSSRDVMSRNVVSRGINCLVEFRGKVN